MQGAGPLDDLLDPLLEPPAVAFLECLLQATQRVEPPCCGVCGDLDGGVMIGRHQLAEVAQPVGHDVEHGTIGGEGHILQEHRRAHTRFPAHEAPIGWLAAGEDLEEGRLPGAVSADHADPLTGIEPQGGVLQQRQMTVGDRDLLKRDERHPTNLPRARVS